MRAQIFIIPSLAFTELDMNDPKTKIAIDSGLLCGFIVNCNDDSDVLGYLKFAADYGHYAEVTLLKDDESWPDIKDRRISFADSTDSSGNSSGVPGSL